MAKRLSSTARREQTTGRFVEKPAATSAQSRTVSKTAAKPHLEAPRTVIKGSWGWVPKDASNDHSDGKKA